MTTVVIQLGHVPRKKGATGTHREQEFVKALGPLIKERLIASGHKAMLVGADDAIPPSDVFVALHTDGSNDKNRRGASVGYPDANGAKLAELWKGAHARKGYGGGFHPNNYTAALKGYYGFGKSRARYRFLAEHGTTTNGTDERWLFDHLAECADAHAEAINALVGNAPTPPPAPPTIQDLGDEDDNMARRKRATGNVKTDNNGNGWLILDGGPQSYGFPRVRWADFISAAPLGSYPPENEYWPLPKIGAQNRGEFVCLELNDGPGNREVGVHVDYVE